MRNKYNPNKSGHHKGLPQRRSIRLKGYDYSQAGLVYSFWFLFRVRDAVPLVGLGLFQTNGGGNDDG